MAEDTKQGLSRRAVLAGGAALASATLMRPMASAAQGAGSGARGLPRRGEFLIQNAYILSMDPQIGDVPRGNIHVRNGAIVAVGPNVAAPDAEVIKADKMIALPGFVETHWHMWGTAARNMAGDTKATGYFPYSRVLGKVFAPEDNARGVRLGIAEALYSGLTTVNNWSHNLLAPEYADAELQAHRDFGARALFSYGYSRKTRAGTPLPLKDVERVHREWFSGGNATDGRITLGIAARGPERNSIEICRKEWETARRIGARISTHIDISAKRLKSRGVMKLDAAGLLGPDVVLVHETHTTPENLETLARTKTVVSLSPFTEMRTGFGFPPFQQMLKAGVPLSFSVDTALLCGSCDMFAIMKAMHNVANASVQSEFGLPARRVIELATIDGARGLGLGDRIGSLTPGKRADLMLVRTTDLNMAPFTDPVHMIVQSAQPSNVDLVAVDGRILKRGGKLVAVDVDKIVGDVNETMTRVQAEVAKNAKKKG